MEELIKMATEAKDRLHLIEVATKQSLNDLEYLMGLFPNGFSMFNQVLSWHEFEPTTMFFTHKGDSVALTGFYNNAITGYNRDKSGFTLISPNELPLEAVPDILALLVERLTPQPKPQPQVVLTNKEQLIEDILSYNDDAEIVVEAGINFGINLEDIESRYMGWYSSNEEFIEEHPGVFFVSHKNHYFKK